MLSYKFNILLSPSTAQNIFAIVNFKKMTHFSCCLILVYEKNADTVVKNNNTLQV